MSLIPSTLTLMFDHKRNRIPVSLISPNSTTSATTHKLSPLTNKAIFQIGSNPPTHTSPSAQDTSIASQFPCIPNLCVTRTLLTSLPTPAETLRHDVEPSSRCLILLTSSLRPKCYNLCCASPPHSSHNVITLTAAASHQNSEDPVKKFVRVQCQSILQPKGVIGRARAANSQPLPRG